MKSLFVLTTVFFSSILYADNVRNLGPGFLNIPYQMGDHLPSQTLPRGLESRINSQVLTFDFTNGVSGTEPQSFKGFGNPRINTFHFIPPVETVFHFVGVKTSLAGCDSSIRPTVSIYSHKNTQRKKILVPGESWSLSKGELTQVTFNLSGWSGCSFKDLAFEYFLTGKMNSIGTDARYTRMYDNFSPESSDFYAELNLEKIYSPIFRYEAEHVSAPFFERNFSQCNFRNDAGSVYDGGPFTLLLEIRLSCPSLTADDYQEVLHQFANLGLVVTEVKAVLAQFQTVAPTPTSNANWYVDRNLPVYDYRSVEIISLVQPHR